MKMLLRAVVIVLGVVASGFAIAQQPPPALTVNPNRHPNLAAAQRLLLQAYEKISAAQAANEFDMEGHANRAKTLIDQADNQLRAASKWSNINGQ